MSIPFAAKLRKEARNLAAFVTSRELSSRLAGHYPYVAHATFECVYWDRRSCLTSVPAAYVSLGTLAPHEE